MLRGLRKYQYLFIQLTLFTGWVIGNSFANGFVITDPNGILNQVDLFLGTNNVPIEKAFQCGQEAVFNELIEKCMIGCEKGGCFTLCFQRAILVTKNVAQCDPMKIAIYSDDGRNVELLSDQYAGIHGNMGRWFLEQLPEFLEVDGVIEVENMTQTSFKLDPNNPHEKPLAAVNVVVRYKLTGFQDGPQILLTLIRDVPGVAQLARMRINESTWFRLKSFQSKK